MIKKKKNVILFICAFSLSFIYNFFIYGINGDEIWNYGFAYNISLGLIPYRDFNMVITPMYSFILSFFIKIFGHHLYVMHIFNALLYAILMVIFYNKLGKKFLILLILILLVSQPGYNFFSLFLMIIYFNISNSECKYKDIYVGIVCSLLFLTKQTIGICLFIPMIFYSKNKFKSLLSFFVPVLIFVCYLVVNDAFYNFIDYCFLGLFDFGGNNSVFVFLHLELLIIFILCFILIKTKFNEKNAFYILAYQIISFPIFDIYHFLCACCVFIYYLLFKYRISNLEFRLYFIISIVFSSFVFYNSLIELVYFENKDSYLYGRMVGSYLEDTIIELDEYIISNYDNYDNLYIFDIYSYLLKMDLGITINKFDLINNGNMGYNGSLKFIDEIESDCEKNRCMFFILDSDVVDQTNEDILEFVFENYSYYDNVLGFNVYIND